MAGIAHALILTLSLLVSLNPMVSLGQEATPASPGTLEPLLDVVVDRALLPGETGFFITGRNVAQPGMRGTYFHPNDKGVIAIIVEDGLLTYQIDQPGGRILRQANTANVSEEPAPAGTPFTLEAGDGLVYPAQKRIESNESDQPVTFLFAVILEPVPPPPPDPSDVGEVETSILGRYDAPWHDLPAGPVALTLSRQPVAAGGHLAADEGSMQAVSQETGTPGALLVGGDGAAINLGSEAVEALVLTVNPSGAFAATPEASPGSGSPGVDIEVTVEEVAAVMLLGEAMPEEDVSFDAWLSFWEPNDGIEFPSYAPFVSIAADVVLAGEQVSASEGRMQVQRGGATEEIAPGTEVTLGPGDAVVYVENSAAQSLRNPGEAMAEAVSFGVFTGSTAITNADWEQSGMAGDDVAVRVERLTLPPGAGLAPYRPNINEPALFAVSTGELTLDVVSPADSATPRATLTFLSGQVIPFRLLPEGLQFVLRNDGSEPLTLIQLTLAPAAPGTAEGTPVE